MIDILTGYRVAPAFFGDLLDIFLYITPFILGFFIIYSFRLGVKSFVFTIMLGFCLFHFLKTLETYEDNFFDCVVSSVDSQGEKSYDCYMRETVDSEWKGPTHFSNASEMLGKKYNKDLY